MAKVNGEFKHDEHEITINVIEPVKGELSYSEGMKIDVDWDSFERLSISEFINVISWMLEKANYIEKNFTKSGKKKD